MTSEARKEEEVKLILIRGNRKPHDYRCRNNIILKSGAVRGCGRFLLRAISLPGAYIEIRCPKCGRMTVIKEEHDKDDKSVSSDVQEKEALPEVPALRR